MKYSPTLFLFLFHTHLSAVVLYDEVDDGDLSDNYLSPTELTLLEGSNEIAGTLLGGAADVDLITLRVESGFVLSSIRVLERTSFMDDGGTFLGIQNGPRLSDDPNRQNLFRGAIGFRVFSASDAASESDILPFISAFAPLNTTEPLPAGDYAIWLNETEAFSTYRLDFVTEAVPEPSVLSLFGITYFFFQRRRR